jgi:hypothetical protein
MNRGDGLVQRRRVVNSSSGGGGGSGLGQDGSNTDLAGHNDKLSGQSPDTDCSSQKDLNCNPTIDEDSDKETRLTLMEEVLLLGLKDKEVCLHSRGDLIVHVITFCIVDKCCL